MSFARPTGFSNAVINSGVGSALEFKPLSQSNNILNGKSINDVGTSMLVSGATYGIFKGIGSIGTAGVNNSSTMTNSLWNAGFRAGSTQMNREAAIIGVSFMLKTTGSAGGVGVSISNSISDNK